MYRYSTAAFLAASSFLQLSSAPFLTAADDQLLQPAADLNEHLPAWLKFSAQFRVRLEDQDGIGLKPISDTHVLDQLYFGVTIQPLGWLTFFGQGVDSRIFFNGPVAALPPYENTWDVHQAWVQFGSSEKYPFTLRFGRQELNFGDQRLVGAAAWLNAPRAFDAVLATVRFPTIRADIFASSVVNNVADAMDHHKQGNPFYGIYVTLPRLVPKASIEPYAFLHHAPVGYTPAYADGAQGKLDEKTIGLRWAGKLGGSYTYEIEVARQFGTLGVDSIRAWAGHWVASRTFNSTLKPRVYAEYNYASGDHNAANNIVGTFDQLYASPHGRFGLTDQVGWRNVRDVRAGVDFQVTPVVTLGSSYLDLWLADPHDGLYGANGAVLARSVAGTAGTHIGQEIDVQATYKVTKFAQIGLGYGHLFTGEFLNKTTAGHDYNFPYIMGTYVF